MGAARHTTKLSAKFGRTRKKDEKERSAANRKMGCAASNPQVAPPPVPADAGGGDLNGDEAGGEWRSRIFGPPGADASANPYPALVVVHGLTKEGIGWLGMQPLAEELAKLGFIVLMVGMPDDDECIVKRYPDAKTVWGKVMAMAAMNAMKTDNMWPAAYYSIAMSQAIDHMIAVAPSELGGLQVDPKRVALVGHSMGGAGVLCAAARDCKAKICAVAALNPGHVSVDGPFDNLDAVLKYGSAPDFSCEHGEGVVPHLANISVPTLIYGSQAEYNTGFEDMKGLGLATLAPCWPSFPCVYEQLTGAPKKELYVDNVVDQTMLEAHTRIAEASADEMRSYQDGVPFEFLCSFLRRNVAGSAEAAPTQPSNAKEWRQDG